MANYTPNYNLGKPEPTDPFGYSSFLPLFNDNMDKIDQIGGGGGSGDLSAHELTQDEYDDLTQEEKESEKDLYFINDVVREEIVTSVDVTRWQNTYEQSMSISVQNDLLTYSWGGGANIGAFSIYQVQIPADATKIRFKLTTGTSYSDTIQRFYICVGVKSFNSTNPTPFPDQAYDNTWIKYVSYNTRNSIIEGELDISDVDDACYLYFSAHGWTLTINEMDIVTEQETSETVRKIMYKDVPYADADTSYLTVVDGELNITFEEE